MNRAASLFLCLAFSSCGLFEVKVPINDIGAFFQIADATWFEDEQTLFVFYRINADQGINEASEVELTYRTDEVDQGFVFVEELEPVHGHVLADCGIHTLCGSWSVHVELPPRDVDIRLRYHRDGELTLAADTAVHIVRSGPAHDARSAVLYGVFDENNDQVQWRLRHQFPEIRNELATDLGLRRDFIVDEVGYGTLEESTREQLAFNPYGYGARGACPGDNFTSLGPRAVATDGRAIFDPEVYPTAAGSADSACGTVTVTDAIGGGRSFTTTAIAQKNPETRSAFSALQTPIVEVRQIPFFLEECAAAPRTLHRDMQKQRLFLEEQDVVCIDDFALTDFPARLGARFQAIVDEERLQGEDMILKIALHRTDNEAIAVAVERALGQLVDEEGDKASPRLVGAFVFDSEQYVQREDTQRRFVLWCPARLLEDEAFTDASVRTCATLPDTRLDLGPFAVSRLQILPPRPQYEAFVDEFGVPQAGEMTAVTIQAPARATISENVELAEFGVATYFNNEAITAAPEEAFSFCASEDPLINQVVFRVDLLPETSEVPLPLQILPDIQEQFPLGRYELGLVWDFPFRVKLEYDAAIATGVESALPFTVAFGIRSPAEQFAGSFTWERDQFDLSNVLEQCTRYCDHPTFDSAGVYNVLEPFAASYKTRCYRPLFPAPPGARFPRDP